MKRELSHLFVYRAQLIDAYVIDSDGSMELAWLSTGRHEVVGCLNRGDRVYLRLRDAHGMLNIVEEGSLAENSSAVRRAYRKDRPKPIPEPPPAATPTLLEAARKVRSIIPEKQLEVRRRRKRYLGHQTILGSVTEWRVEYSIQRAIGGWIVYIDGEDDCHDEVGPTDAAGIVDGLEEHCLDVAEFATDLDSTDDPSLIELAEDIRELSASAGEGAEE